MAIALQQEIKIKGLQPLTVSITADSAQAALAEYEQVKAHFNLPSQIDATAIVNEVTKSISEVMKPPAEQKPVQQPAVATMSTRRRKTANLTQLNDRVLQAAQLTSEVVEHFHGKQPFEVVEMMGIKKALAEMNEAELKEADDVIRGILQNYAANNKPAQNYLFIIEQLSAALSIAEYEKIKSEIPADAWASVKENPRLFELGKQFGASKRKQLEVAEVISNFSTAV